MTKYIIAFLISMIPLIELRAGVPAAVAMGMNEFVAIAVCAVGNMLPVPFIYFFARKFKLCTFFVEKGEKAGRKLTAKTGRGGLFVALLLFVGIPLPGTGAWTGTLAASFLNMGFKSAVVSVTLGVLLAGIIMATISTGAFSIIGL